MATRQHQELSLAEIAHAAAPRGDWTPEQAVDLPEQGHPGRAVAARTGHDLSPLGKKVSGCGYWYVNGSLGTGGSGGTAYSPHYVYDCR